MLITQNVNASQVDSIPFPHLIVPDIFPDVMYRELRDALPDLSVLSKGLPVGSNKRFNYSATNIAFNPNISMLWKSLAQEHLSQSFLDDFLRLFGSHILERYPDFAMS